jgi:hypothetical protein
MGIVLDSRCLTPSVSMHWQLVLAVGLVPIKPEGMNFPLGVSSVRALSMITTRLGIRTSNFCNVCVDDNAYNDRMHCERVRG